MSTALIHRIWKVEGVLTNVSSYLLSDPDGNYGIKETVSGDTVIADGTAMTQVSTGVYEYTFTIPDTTLAYTAYVEFVYGGSTYHFEHDIAAITVTTKLGPTYADIRRAIGRFMGYGRDPTSPAWNTDEVTDCNDVMKSGLRKFYWPPTTGDRAAYEWSFLEKSGSFAMVSADYDYDLPADFAVLAGNPVVSATTGGVVQRIPWVELEAKRARATATEIPTYCAVRPKTPDPTTGSRFELLCYPTPNSTDPVNYRYVCEPDMIDGTNEYPLGGAVHGETILNACLAAAEAILKDTEGLHAQKFAVSLAASVRVDREAQVV